MKANYEKAKTLLPNNTYGIWWVDGQDMSYESSRAKISTYAEFLKTAKKLMDEGKLYKTFEYGWRDGKETSTVLYTDFLIDIKAKSGHRMGFDAVESYNTKTELRKYVKPTKSNARFWEEYNFVRSKA